MFVSAQIRTHSSKVRLVLLWSNWIDAFKASPEIVYLEIGKMSSFKYFKAIMKEKLIASSRETSPPFTKKRTSDKTTPILPCKIAWDSELQFFKNEKVLFKEYKSLIESFTTGFLLLFERRTWNQNLIEIMVINKVRTPEILASETLLK